MSLELIREAIKVSQVIGEESTQTVVENDIIVPDVKPDIARILLLDGDACVNRTEVMQDKILINGTINYKILYISDDPESSIKSINTGAGFSHSMNIPGARQGMNCRIKFDIEHMEYNILNGRKVNVKAIVGTSSRIQDEVEQDFVNDLRGIENIQVLKNSINVNCYVGDNEVACNVRENLEVPSGKPAVREILRNDVKITGKDYKITDNKIIAKGDLNISTLYIGDDETQGIQFMEHEIPFTQFVDLPGVDENSVCEVDYKITDAQFEPSEDSDGEMRVLGGEIVLGISAAGYSKKSVEVVEDAYTPHINLGLEKKPCKVTEVVADNKSQITVKDTLALQDGSPDIVEVFNVLCKLSLTEYKIIDGKVVVEGVANNDVLYLADNAEQPVSCHRQEIPFRHAVDVKDLAPDANCDIALDVENCNYSMASATEVEVRLTVSVNVKVIKHISVPLISKAVEYPADEKRFASQPSLIIYFSQPDDTLWKVAKKYYTTMDDVRAANNISDGEEITPGQQIIIPRKVS